jgi:hypothetical protein
MMTGREILNILEQHFERIGSLGVKKIGLFGSFSRSEVHRSSDLDFIVEFRPGEKSFDRYMDLKFFLENLFHRKIDLVIKDTLKKSIKTSVLKNAIYAEP